MVVLVMGVSGSGKTTVGKQLATRLGVPFIEGDAYHSVANREKMAAGIPLTDADRQPWLEALAGVLAKAEQADGGVLASSALKAAYREVLGERLQGPLQIVYLQGTRELLLSRLRARKGHFFPPALLDSQLSTLEPPSDAVTLDVALPVEELVAQAAAQVHRPAP